MAFVQPQASVHPQNTGLPPNLTSQYVQEVYQKFRQMQEQGVRQDDPEYIKAHTLLAAVQRQQNWQKQRQLQFLEAQRRVHQQQQQQQQQLLNQHQQQQHQQHSHQQHQLQQHQQHQQHQQQQSPTQLQPQQQLQQQQPQQPQPPQPPAQQPNGLVTDNAPNGIDARNGSSGTNVATAASPASALASNNLPSNQKNATPGPGTFTPEQLATLKNQILAFKMLTKNLPIPPRVQQQLFASKRQPPGSTEAASAPEQAIDNSNREASVKAPESAMPKQKTMYETFKSPFDALNATINYSEHSMRRNRLRIPSIMPIGVDIEKIREDREIILYNRITARKAELAKLPANLGVWDSGESDAPDRDDSMKLKALIEYKMLNLLPKQRAFRKQIQTEMLHFDNLAMASNRSAHRRMKKQSLREARVTEKLEKQQRDARQTKEKQKQYDQLQAILNHGRDIQTAATHHRARIQKLGRLMVQHHQHMEREEQKRVERTAKQRLQALKANDEETYMKLLGQAKDSRISHLLKQTDGFLRQLAASVRAQQRSTAERYGEEDEELEEDIMDSEEEEDDTRKVDYYAVAHRIKEDISVQPGILVGGTLKEYQIRGLQWMISLYNNNLNGILADEMGLGKTIQTISLITYLIEKKKQNGPYLVVVPLSTLTNWNLEFEKWAPSITRIVYKGPPTTRKAQQQAIRWGNFQVLLTTYEYIIKDRPVLSKVKWLHMIIDEGHRMKNSGSKLSSTLTTYYNSRYRLILTGTPLQNNLPELWALLNFVLPNIFKSVKSFDEWFNTPFANTGGQDRMELTEEEQLLVIRRLHKVLRPFLLRRLKKDVEKDLPDKQERVVKCRFSALQTKLYKQLVTHNKMVVSDGKGGKTGMRGLSNMLMQLRKLCNHPFVFESVEDEMNPGKATNDLIWRTAGKFELLDRVLPKFHVSGHRVLMFFQMTQIMNIMEDFLRLRGYKYLRLDGSTKSDDRSELLKLFNEPGSEYFCFLLSTRAGGLGLNLQTADTVIIYDSDWNPHQDLQAQDRAHRIGQKNEVRILRLISSNSVEERILERAQFKLDMDGKVIQAGKFDNKSTNEERDALLRTLLETAETADQLNEQDEMDDDDLNDIMARSEEELVLFQKMDEERAKSAKYGPGQKLPRLMGEDELPDLYLAEDNPVTEEVEEVAGRGARERKTVRYDDGLTEEQWLLAVDGDEDTLEDTIAKNEARLDRLRTNREKRAKKTHGAESSPEPSRETSATPQTKKRRKVPPPKRKADEILDEAPVKRRRGRQSKVADTLGNSERANLQKILSNVYQTLIGLEEDVPPETSDSEDEPLTRSIIEPFMKPPPKSQYPDYYMIIQTPMAMDLIKKKINREEYRSPKEFREDIRLLCHNARTYNEDGSLLFQDANTIENTCVAELKKETEQYPEFTDFDDLASSAGDGQSAAVSSVGTPLASSSGPKLKLTFNGTNSNREHAMATGTESGAVSDEE